MKTPPQWFDNGTIQVWQGITGWCFTSWHNGKKTGGLGYSSLSAALTAARASV